MKIKKSIILCGIILVFTIGIIPNKIVFAEAAQSKNNALSSEILIERDSLRVLYASNENIRRGIASTTKILTALCVLNNSALDKVVEITDEMVGIEGSSVYLRRGEKYTVEQLLYGLMLRSGNDAATALAISTSGSIENFAKLMNDTALNAGAKNSSFCNPHGLDDEEHYSTAYDLALITAVAMKNQEFEKIVNSEYYSFNKIGTEEKIVWVNKNKLLKKGESFNGVKTGFTKKCGRCLVAAKKENGMQLIAVALNVGPMFERCETLLNNGFKEYSLKKILASGVEYVSLNVADKKKISLFAGVKKDVYYPLTDEEYASLSYEFEKTNVDLNKKDLTEAVGKINVFSEKRLIYSAESFIIIPH